MIRNSTDTSGFVVNHNVYLAGAGKFPNQDQQSVVDRSETPVEFHVDDDSIRLRFNVPSSVFDAKYPWITSKLIGKVPRSEMSMEHPDGTPLNLTSDFFGHPIDPKNVLPGPFQKITASTNDMILWPR